MSKYKRLTNPKWKKYQKPSSEWLDNMYCRLAELEDLIERDVLTNPKGLTKEQILWAYEMDVGMLKDEIERLAELGDKIEAGKLVELPLKVGDTVYSVGFIFRDGYEIDKKGNERPVHSSGWRIHEEKITDKNIYKMCDLYVNDKVYTTREAAEEKLKELEKKLNELSEGKQ